ncbi:MAG: hypothetical protein HKL96_05445 [Phycisphaerales bacterium]|nr:hypothetical protein [Phycisphaerales bacterium]
MTNMNHTRQSNHKYLAVASGALAALLMLPLAGCTQTVVRDDSVNTRLGASLPPGAEVHYGTGVSGGSYRSHNTEGTQVPAGSYTNPAAPDNWVDGWGAGGQQ